MLFVLSGSSGAGKDAVLARMKELGLSFHQVVTMTTRPRREAESDGVDYYFTTESEFHDMARRGQLLEWANVYGNWYGVPRRHVQQALEEGKDAVVRVDVQGAATIKSLVPGAVLIFLASESVDDYEQRLKKRNTESDADVKRRIDSVEEELKSLPLFDYVVVNRQGELDATVSEIAAIMTAERCRVTPRLVEVP